MRRLLKLYLTTTEVLNCILHDTVGGMRAEYDRVIRM